MQTRSLTTSLRHGRRRGILSMELVLTLPILGILLLGILEFTMLFFAQGTVAEASRLGARRATMQGATDGDVEEQVQFALGPRLSSSAEIRVQGAQFSGEPVIVAVAVPMTAASPDLLWPIGFGLQGQFLVSEARMAKE
ncbi:MAG: pilus assembly protein [Planctomycetaceae bacterium]|nr:pilus assembly protein [Planctomycetaceae bacterium]